MRITDLAPELTDSIIDQLYDDPSSLKATALACRRFLAASQFHLFTDVEIKPRRLSTHPFPSTLAHLVRKLRLATDSEPQAFFPWSLAFGGRHIVPSAPPTSEQLRAGLVPFKAKTLELEGVKSSVNSSTFAAVVSADDLANNVASLSLTNCCIDAEDSLTLAYSFPRLRSLRFSALTFDNSRSVIRKMEHASPIRCWAFGRTGPDWSTISDSVSYDRELNLNEVEVHDTEWTENLRAMMVSLFDHLASPSEQLNLRVNVTPSDLSQTHSGGLSAFGEFLTESGSKIHQLDLCLGDVSRNEKEVSVSAGSTCPEIQLNWIFDLCPGLEVLRLSGSLCTREFVEQTFDKLKPSIRIIGLGDAGEEIDWHKVVNPFLTFGSNAEQVVISERGSSRDEEKRRCDLALKKLGQVRV